MLLTDFNDFWSIFHLGALINAYVPLILWTGVGLVASRFAPINASKFLGVALYFRYALHSLCRDRRVNSQLVISLNRLAICKTGG